MSQQNENKNMNIQVFLFPFLGVIFETLVYFYTSLK